MSSGPMILFLGRASWFSRVGGYSGFLSRVVSVSP